MKNTLKVLLVVGALGVIFYLSNLNISLTTSGEKLKTGEATLRADFHVGRLKK